MTSQPIPILLYHSISDEASDAFRTWTVGPTRFAEHMSYISESGFTALTVTSLCRLLDERKPLPTKPIVITFDDGFADFATAASPVLVRHGLPTTFYITTKFVGGTSEWLRKQGEGDRPFLSWNQIANLDEDLVEIGAHSHTHPTLDVLPERQATLEITESKRILDDHLDRPVMSFAYPHGYSTRRVRATVHDTGFTSACGVAHAINTSKAERFAMPRIIVSADTTVDDLARLIRGDGLRVAPFREQYRTKGWRLARRVVATTDRVRRRTPTSQGPT